MRLTLLLLITFATVGCVASKPRLVSSTTAQRSTGLEAGIPPAAPRGVRTPVSIAVASTHEAQLLRMLSSLGSLDFHERTAAQHELDRTTVDDLSILTRYARETTDEEIEARLRPRIRVLLRRVHAVDPPPVTLDLHHATLAEIAAALSEDSDAEFITSSARDLDIKAKEEPFWQVVYENGLVVQEYGDQKLHLDVAPDFPRKQLYTAVGPLAIPPPVIKRADNKRRIDYTVQIDPRIKMIRYEEPWIQQVVDDAGSVLYKGNPNGHWSANLRLSVFEDVFECPAPAPGRKIAVLQGRMSYVAQVAREQLAIPAANEKLGKEFTVGGWKVNLLQAQGKFRFNFVRLPSAGPDNCVEVFLRNANGQLIYYVKNDITCEHINGYGSDDPFDALISATTQVKAVTVPFELKDIAVP